MELKLKDDVLEIIHRRSLELGISQEGYIIALVRSEQHNKALSPFLLPWLLSIPFNPVCQWRGDQAK